ncbi:MAG TPA: ATP-binding protein, partial [Sphingomonas sp.]|nr:ATP-binding protein [Sphingomonas sp.]
NVPTVRLQEFAAAAFADELVRMVAIEWPQTLFATQVDAGVVLRADADLLAQALINLLRNAAQATNADSEPAAVTLRIASDAAGAVVISVADNGAGVPDALHREIFLPFYTTRTDGTGIGLNLVRQIVIAHGWSIDVGRSDAGGAEFVLRTGRTG